MTVRCAWANADPLYIEYHDNEWGTPLHDDARFFEMLVLEGAQAGLSWLTILKKRENYRKAFEDWNVERIARYDAVRIEALLSDQGIIRNKRKIASAVQNARAFLEVQEAFGSFDRYIWQFVQGTPIQNTWKDLEQIPAITKESVAMSRDLKERGFTFVGPTICYAFMQSVGMVNDHVTDCFRHRQLSGSVKAVS